MVEVRGFRAVEYDAAKVELAKVTSPPFDLIDGRQAAAFRKRSPFNVVRATLPESKSGAGPPAYEAVAPLLESWLAQGILRQRPEESIYGYEVRYASGGQERRLRSVLLLLRIDPEYKQVIPHERTFEKPMEDRLRVLEASGWDLEPIQMLYAGSNVETTLWAYVDGKGRPPDLLVTGLEGAQHLLWRVTDAAIIGTVVEGFKGRKAYIADGHHRYAAAARYAARRRERAYRPPRASPYDYKMVQIVNLSDSGLAILPTHRVILRSGIKKPAEFVRAAEGPFEVQPESLKDFDAEAVPERLGSDPRPTFLVYFGKRNLVRLVARLPALPESAAPGASLSWRSLEVATLQTLVVRDLFGIPEERWGDDVKYTRDAHEALEAVDAKKALAAVFHRPVRAQQMRAVADGGETMPPKSTFFVPKLVSGLAFYRIGTPSADEIRRRPTS